MTDEDTIEIRVRLDASCAARLRAHRLLRNKTMADTVQEALDLYFAQIGFPDVAIPSSGTRRALW